jgi:hypothetical protein
MISLANSKYQLVQRADPELGRGCWICLRAIQVSYVRVGLTNISEIHELGLDNSTQNDNTCLTGPAIQIIGETKQVQHSKLSEQVHEDLGLVQQSIITLQ